MKSVGDHHPFIRPSQLIAGTAADKVAAPASTGMNGGMRSFSEQLRFLSRTYEELDVRLDPNTHSVWCYLRPKGQPSFTPLLARELTVLHHAIQALVAFQEPHEEPHVRYYVLASQIP